MRHGGESQYGSAQYGGMPWGIQPSYVLEQMKSALSIYRKTPTGGCVNTIEELFGSIEEPEVINLALKSQTPAYLVNYRGASWEPKGTRGSQFSGAHRFVVLSISSNWRDRRDRIDNRNIYYPSCESMSAWAFREIVKRFQFDIQTARPEDKVYKMFPVNEEPFLYINSRFIYMLEFECQLLRDVYDNPDDGAQFEELGIVHTPQPEPAPLFQEDGVTPNSDDPTNNTPNVADMVEE